MSREGLESATIAKVTWRLIPFLLLLYIVAWLDRVNVGFAALQMNQDLGFSAVDLWIRRRRVLHRLRAVRNSQQPDSGARRRAALDRAHHGHVGRARGGDDVRAQSDELLCVAIPARRCRGGLPARHHLLPVELVSGRTARHEPCRCS